MVAVANDRVLAIQGLLQLEKNTGRVPVRMKVTRETLSFTACGHKLQIQRHQFSKLQRTSVLGLFRIGFCILHHHADLPNPLIFYPQTNRKQFEMSLRALGWI